MIVVAVAVAGAAGASARVAIERLVSGRVRSELPLASYVVNPLGAFALAVIVGLALDGSISDETVTVLGTGFCGAFTVVGPVTFDSLRLAFEGRRPTALVNVAVGMLLPLAAAGLGLAIT